MVEALPCNIWGSTFWAFNSTKAHASEHRTLASDIFHWRLASAFIGLLKDPGLIQINRKKILSHSQTAGNHLDVLRMKIGKHFWKWNGIFKSGMLILKIWTSHQLHMAVFFFCITTFIHKNAAANFHSKGKNSTFATFFFNG